MLCAQLLPWQIRGDSCGKERAHTRSSRGSGGRRDNQSNGFRGARECGCTMIAVWGADGRMNSPAPEATRRTWYIGA